MNVNNLTAALCEYISLDLLEGEVPVSPDSLFSEIGLDSLFMMELIVTFERLSGHRVAAATLSSPKLISVRSLIELTLSDCANQDLYAGES
jgi:acyl carrier protein